MLIYHLRLQGQRGLYLQRVYTQFQMQVFAAQGKYSDLLNNDSFVISNRKMWDGIEVIEDAHQKLYLAVDGLVPAETDLYTMNEM